MPTLLANQPPQFITTRPERPMKVVDLVTHTSGLTYGFMMRTSVDAAYRRLKVNAFDTPGGLDTFIEQLSTLPLEFSPGTKWNYSVSIDVMGYLVQKLSGMSFGEFLRTRLFEPLGMTDTGFYVPPEKLDRFSSCYQPAEGGGLKVQDDAGKSTYATPPSLEAGGGGLVSSAHDYMRFCQMMLAGGTLDGVQILSPKTVALFSLASPATTASASPSAAASTSTSPRPSCRARWASSTGAAPPPPPSGSTRRRSWRWCS
jgi:CubicO group peptidase (beta-lactamase class C family)